MRSLRLALHLIPLFAASGALRAQCPPTWQTGLGLTGADGTIHASTMWDPDGPGPATPLLVLGGDFRAAGTVVTDRIAAWSPATGVWSALGGGLDGSVRALAVLPTGELIAAGSFGNAGGVPAARIASWNGTNWSPLGAGMDFDVRALAVLPGGDLVAGGMFTTAGGVASAGLALWDGSAWSQLGGGLSASASALLALPNGDLLVGGDFLSAGGTPVHRIARWDGSVWSPLGSGADGAVRALHRLPNGDVVAGGAGTIGGVANRVGRWDGSAWSAIGFGVFTEVRALLSLPSGELLAGLGTSAIGIASWNGTAWNYDSSGPIAPVNTLAALPNGDLVAGGGFMVTGSGLSLRHLVRRTASSWTALGPSGFDDRVSALLALPDGSVVAGGRFSSIGGTPVSRIARQVGGSWQALGTGISGEVLALARLPNGDLLAGGGFTIAGGVSAMRLARWNGSSWSEFGGGVVGSPGQLPSVNVIRVRPNGDVVIGGAFSSVGGVPAANIARWNGSSWSPLGQSLGSLPQTLYPVGSVDALAELPNGALVAGGQFPLIGAVVARWDGFNWVPLTGLPGNRVQALLVRNNGDLLANAGPGTALHRWTGTGWSALPASPIGSVWAMRTLPDGDVLVGGYLNGGNLVRWNGATWTSLGDPNSTVEAMAVTPAGELVVGGSFQSIGGQLDPNLSRVRSSCPATTAPTGAGCTGSGGTMVLTATSLPWLGSSATARATGLPANSLALGLRGFALGSWPLLLPNAGPGCLQFASSDLIDLYLPNAGVVQTALAIPDSAALVGVIVHEQMVGIRFDASGGVPESVSSNALSLTLGDF